MVFSEILYLLVTAVSVLFVLVIMPLVIRVANRYQLFDDQSPSRKDHGYGVPRLGGVAFFLSIVFTGLFFKIGIYESLPIPCLYAAGAVLFLVGFVDDLSGVACFTKLIFQIIAGCLITVPGNIRINNLHGILNMHQLSYTESVGISIFIIVFIINSFNLIDGIDGLAGTLGVIAALTFGYYFMRTGHVGLAALALLVAGSLIPFLAYNYSPTKIFMGDCGSLFLGLSCAVFALKFITINEASALNNTQAAPAIAVAALIVPLFDTFTVVITRICNKKSPFRADRNHIHHRLLRLGLNHMQTTALLALVTLFFIGFALLLRHADSQLLLMLFAAIMLALNLVVNLLLKAKNKQVFWVSAE
ncbi:MAG: glycosyltransferase family 4 protein [Mucilaginibacter sp.]|uniref:glycosyltransferase family 4 protein n=1 Tax=Mucilaginibacter sp. TaxID=1882438 RepID=UPI0034E4C886